MVKKTTRSPATVNKSRYSLIKAKDKTVKGLYDRAQANNAVSNSLNKAEKLKEDRDTLVKDSKRIKKAGARMAKAQAYSKKK